MDAAYRRQRLRVFIGIFVGYAAYYLVRKNFALAMPDILAEHKEYTKTQLGTAMSGLALAYGFSKFIMGSVSDRSNPRWFLPLGLVAACVILFIFGFGHAVYASLPWMIALQTLNGWINGMGWAPCGKTMVHWFSTTERCKVVSVWNTAHNVGGALLPLIAMAGVWLFHDWGAKFYFNGFAALLCAAVAWWLMRDSPQSCGLPAIEQHRNDFPPGYDEAHEQTLTFRQILFDHVLNNRLLWCIAIANAFLYYIRYGVEDWIPTYLQTAKHYSFRASGLAWSCYEWAAVPGTLLCGWVSETWFKGRRAPASVLFTAMTLLGVVLYGLNQQGPLWLDVTALIIIGFFIYGPIMIIGLHALDLVQKKAAGAAAGLTGFFGYVFGSSFAGTGVGWISEHWGWRGVFDSLIGACVLAMVFCLPAWNHRAQSSSQS